MSKTFMTIDDVEKGGDRDAIWAINNSADSTAGQVGDVHVGIPKINGSKIDPLFIPQTWLPQRLTDQIPRAQLLAASEFRRAVNSRLIKLVTPEYAKELLEGTGAEEEQERLNQAQQAVRDATAARSITQANTDIINTAELADEVVAKTERDPNELNPAFIMFVNSLNNKSDIEAMNLIRGRGKLSRQEVVHLIRELRDKPLTVKMLEDKINGPKAKA